MSPLGTIAALLVAAAAHSASPGDLPVCANRVINEVVRRSGCLLGDGKCWFRAGGFCMDYVKERVGGGRGVALEDLTPVGWEEVRRGDVAVFLARAHYAYVERVVRDKRGRPVRIDLSEYNFGSCWVDRNALVTDQYKSLGRRFGVAVGEVDGGFLRLVR